MAQENRAAKDNEVDDAGEEERDKEKDEKLDEEQHQDAGDRDAPEERLVHHPVNELQARAQQQTYRDKQISKPVPRAGWRLSEKQSDINQGISQETQEGQGYNRLVAEQRGQQEPDISRQGGREQGQAAQDLSIRAAGQYRDKRPDVQTENRQEAEQQGREQDNDNGQEDQEVKEHAHLGRGEPEVENVGEQSQKDRDLSRQSINKQVAEMQEEEKAKKHDALHAVDTQEKIMGAVVPSRAVKVDPQVDEEVHQADQRSGKSEFCISSQAHLEYTVWFNPCTG